MRQKAEKELQEHLLFLPLLNTLEHSSRDLECMVWLAMAELFSEHPYVRLAGVILLIQSAVEAFWPQIQPWLPDNDIESAARECPLSKSPRKPSSQLKQVCTLLVNCEKLLMKVLVLRKRLPNPIYPA